MFGLEKLCSVCFFKVSKWNVIFVGGYEYGKNFVLKKKSCCYIYCPKLMDGHVYGSPPIQLMGCFKVYPSTCWVSSQNRNVG